MSRRSFKLPGASSDTATAFMTLPGPGGRLTGARAPLRLLAWRPGRKRTKLYFPKVRGRRWVKKTRLKNLTNQSNFVSLVMIGNILIIKEESSYLRVTSHKTLQNSSRR